VTWRKERCVTEFYCRMSKAGCAMPTPNAWMTVEHAAAFLSLTPVALRRALERNARPAPEGGTISRTDGISARKLGRLWRVWLDPGWLAPSPPK